MKTLYEAALGADDIDAALSNANAVSDAFVEGFRATLNNSDLDPAFR